MGSMIETTQREVYETLREHGPMNHDELAEHLWPDEFCGECEREHDDSDATSLLSVVRRRLNNGGYISTTLDWRIAARDLDELSAPPEAFGAGAGDTFEGELPPDDPITPETAFDR